jgi:hypothetical protein
MPPVPTAPATTAPHIRDLEAIDAMLTAARDHAAAFADAAAPGSVLRTRATTLIRSLERASSEASWLLIDLQPRQHAPTAPAPPAETPQFYSSHRAGTSADSGGNDAHTATESS